MPLNRRALIQSGLLVPALGSLTAQSALARTATNGIWLIDDELPEALTVAAEVKPAAAVVHAFSSDPGRIWMRELAPRLRRKPVALGGYTSAATLFCLQYLARDHGLGLAALGPGSNAPTPFRAGDDIAPIDLRGPAFADPRAACTWLMLPRRA